MVEYQIFKIIVPITHNNPIFIILQVVWVQRVVCLCSGNLHPLNSKLDTIFGNYSNISQLPGSFSTPNLIVIRSPKPVRVKSSMQGHQYLPEKYLWELRFGLKNNS
jgi:hypothetical protein